MPAKSLRSFVPHQKNFVLFGSENEMSFFLNHWQLSLNHQHFPKSLGNKILHETEESKTVKSSEHWKTTKVFQSTFRWIFCLIFTLKDEVKAADQMNKAVHRQQTLLLWRHSYYITVRQLCRKPVSRPNWQPAFSLISTRHVCKSTEPGETFWFPRQLPRSEAVLNIRPSTKESINITHRLSCCKSYLMLWVLTVHHGGEEGWAFVQERRVRFFFRRAAGTSRVTEGARGWPLRAGTCISITWGETHNPH